MDLQQFKYIGWIPCLCGRLFFDLSDCGLSNRRVFATINHAEGGSDGVRRRILVASDVDWKDEDESECLAGSDTESRVSPQHWSGAYHALLVSDFPHGATEIDGEVHLLPEDIADGDGPWKDVTAAAIRMNEKIAHQQNIVDDFITIKEQLATRADPQHRLVKFRIDQFGFVMLRPEPVEGTADHQGDHVLSRQAYYYIKYTFHQHQHHDKGVDSLTTIHPIPAISTDIGCMLVEELKHSLVELKRRIVESDYQGLVHTKGIISYAKSLVVASHANGFMRRPQADQQQQFLDNLDTSIQVRVEAFNTRLQTARERESRFHTKVLLLLALLAPFTIVYKEKIAARLFPSGADGEMEWLATLLANLLGGRWEAVIFLVLIIGAVLRWLGGRSKRPFAAPLISKYRGFIDFAASNSKIKTVLWKAMIILGSALASASAWWLVIGPF